MAAKTKRYMDEQGRIILPSHIRKALNLTAGNVVEVELEEDNTISIRAIAERCCICGGPLEGKDSAEIAKDKKICPDCAHAIVKVMGK